MINSTQSTVSASRNICTVFIFQNIDWTVKFNKQQQILVSFAKFSKSVLWNELKINQNLNSTNIILLSKNVYISVCITAIPCVCHNVNNNNSTLSTPMWMWWRRMIHDKNKNRTTFWGCTNEMQWQIIDITTWSLSSMGMVATSSFYNFKTYIHAYIYVYI